MKIPATTIIETIVASAVFLIVFLLAMDSAVRINGASRSEWSDFEKAFNECRDSLENAEVILNGKMDSCSMEYPWGTMVFVFEPSPDIEGLTEVTVKATLKGGRKATYRYLSDNHCDTVFFEE